MNTYLVLPAVQKWLLIFSINLVLVGMLGHIYPALAAKRAFIVGIDRYDNLDPRAQLQRAVNDARSVATVLRDVGYDVSLHEDLTRSEFNSAWQSFLDTVAVDDVVAIFYAGHGIEIDRQNYLLPRSIPNVAYGREAQIKRESLSLSELLLDLRNRKPRISLIILDACREHPLAPTGTRAVFGSRGGLSSVAPSNGMFIMYSAGESQTALDRLGDNDPNRINSVYTRKLVPLLRKTGISLEDMAGRLQYEVSQLAAKIHHQQVPAYYDNVVGRFCVAGCELKQASLKLPPGSTPVLSASRDTNASKRARAIRRGKSINIAKFSRITSFDIEEPPSGAKLNPADIIDGDPYTYWTLRQADLGMTFSWSFDGLYRLKYLRFRQGGGGDANRYVKKLTIEFIKDGGIIGSKEIELERDINSQKIKLNEEVVDSLSFTISKGYGFRGLVMGDLQLFGWRNR